MEPFEKIKKLRLIVRKTTYEVSDATGISQSTISKIENDKKRLDADILKKLADYFNVSYDFLLNDSEIDSCHVCGAHYCPLEKEDFEAHGIRHKNFLNFPEKHLFLTYSNRDVIKRKCHEILQNESSSTFEKVDATIKLYQCWYARSIEASNFNISHPSFTDYIAMMLNRKESKEDLPEPVYKLLVQKYGIKDGISDGKSYYDLDESELFKKNETDIQKPLMEILNMLQNSENELVFNGELLDDLTRELLIQSLENSIKMAEKIVKKNILQRNDNTKE